MFLEQDLATPRSSRAASVLSNDDVTAASRGLDTMTGATATYDIDEAKLVSELQEKMKVYRENQKEHTARLTKNFLHSIINTCSCINNFKIIFCVYSDHEKKPSSNAKQAWTKHTENIIEFDLSLFNYLRKVHKEKVK